MLINGVTLDFDFFDVDFFEKYQTSNERLVKDIEKIQTEMKSGKYKDYECLKKACNLVFDFFDEVFGEGTSNTLFGDRVNSNDCLNALLEVRIEVEKQKKVSAINNQEKNQLLNSLLNENEQIENNSKITNRVQNTNKKGKKYKK